MAFTIQIVGLKNSGKTTLILDLLKLCQDKNISTTVIKHTHEQIKISETTDTGKFQQLSPNTFLIDQNEQIISYKKNITNPITNILESSESKINIIEGYKQLHFPKIVIVNNQDDLNQLASLPNILAFVSTFGFQNQQVIDVSQINQRITFLTNIINNGDLD